MNAKIINVRFNLDKEKHRQAWAALQQLRQERGWSNPESISEALVAFTKNRGTIEQTEEETIRRCAERITAMTQEMMKLALPAFLSGLAVQGDTAAMVRGPTAEMASEPQMPVAETDTIPDDEIPWDYLGE